MIKNYLKIAIRNLAGNKLLSFINIAGLSLALTACILILLFANNETGFDHFHKKKDNIYQLVCNRVEKDGQQLKSALAAMVQGPAFKEGIPEIQSFTRVDQQLTVIKREKETFRENITWVDDNFFSMFTFPLIKGNSLTVLSGFNSIVLSADAALKYFGSLEITGQRIDVEVDGQLQPFIVSGIAEPPPKNSTIQFSFLLPFKFLEKNNPDNGWLWFSFPTFFLLKPASDIKAVTRKMEKVYQLQAKSEIDMNHDAGYDTKFNWGLEPLTKMHLNTDYQGEPGGGDPIYIYILSAIAFFILIIACMNFINLSIARSMNRNREIGMRKVMGGTRTQLIAQFLGESMFICLLSFILAILSVLLVLPFFNRLAGTRIQLASILNYRLWLGLLTLYLFTFLGAGSYPAIFLSGLNPIQSIQQKAQITGKNLLAKILVVIQFALATGLIIATLFFQAQFNFLTSAAQGYKEKNLVEFIVDKGIMDKTIMDRCKSRFAAIPGVLSVGYNNVGKFGGKTQAGGHEFAAVYLHTDQDYLATLGPSLFAGRLFSPSFPSDSTESVIINESFAREAGWLNPVGHTVDFLNIPGWGNRKITVIGLIHDYHSESFREKIKPELYIMDTPLPFGHFIIRINPATTATTVRAMENTFHGLFPEQPFEYAFRDETLQRNYATESRWKQIITMAALLTIFISCTGLFGLALLTIRKRVREIGIRKVLGAGTASLVTLITVDFLTLVLISMFIATPLAWLFLNRWLMTFAYRIRLAPGLFLLSGAIALIIAMLTVCFHAIKASLANPVDSLKTD